MPGDVDDAWGQLLDFLGKADHWYRPPTNWRSLMQPHIIELRGSYTATFNEYEYTSKSRAHDPIPPFIRRLIAERVIGRNDIVVVKRGTTVCFKPCRARAWAKLDVIDNDQEGLVRRRAQIGPNAPGADGWR